MLEIKDLAKRYGNVAGLDGASFTARPGRIVGFLGPNGAGKTTTMRSVFGLARPDRGEVRWKSAPVDREVRLRFGYMPEQRGLYPRMRVGEQVNYFAQQHGLSGKAGNAAAARWLERSFQPFLEALRGHEVICLSSIPALDQPHVERQGEDRP